MWVQRFTSAGPNPPGSLKKWFWMQTTPRDLPPVKMEQNPFPGILKRRGIHHSDGNREKSQRQTGGEHPGHCGPQ